MRNGSQPAVSFALQCCGRGRGRGRGRICVGMAPVVLTQSLVEFAAQRLFREQVHRCDLSVIKKKRMMITAARNEQGRVENAPDAPRAVDEKKTA